MKIAISCRRGCKITKNYQFDTKILVASVRHPVHVLDAALIGGDVATIPLKTLTQLFKHPLTDKGIEQFIKDSKKWANKVTA